MPFGQIGSSPILGNSYGVKNREINRIAQFQIAAFLNAKTVRDGLRHFCALALSAEKAPAFARPGEEFRKAGIGSGVLDTLFLDPCIRHEN